MGTDEDVVAPATRRTRGYVEPAINSIMEYELGLVTCLRDLVGDLDKAGAISPHMNKLRELTSNRTTARALVGFGGVNLVIHSLSTFPEEPELKISCCEVLRILASYDPDIVLTISALEGTEALLDVILEPDCDPAVSESCFATIRLLAETSNAQKVLATSGFPNAATSVILSSSNEPMVNAALQAMCSLSLSGHEIRETLSESNVHDLLKSLKASVKRAKDDEKWLEIVVLLLDVLGNLCLQSASKKNAIQSGNGVHVLVETLQMSEEKSTVQEHGYIALSRCVADHEANIRHLLDVEGLEPLLEAMKRYRDETKVIDACLDVLVAVANFTSVSFQCPITNSFSVADALEFVVGLLRDRRGDIMKITSYFSRLGLTPSLKEKLVQSGAIEALIDLMRLKPVEPANVIAGLLTLAHIASGSNAGKLLAGEKGVYETTIALIEEHEMSMSRESELVVQHGILLLDNVADGCSPNQERASADRVIHPVLKCMQTRMNDWRIQQHGLNLLVKVAGLNSSVAQKLMESGALLIAEKAPSTHTGNMMVESGARTLVSILQSQGRGRNATATGGPTVRRQSRTREKAPEGMSRGSSRGPQRDKSVSPTREIGARRRGASVEPTMNRNRMDMRRGRNKAPFALEPVKE